MEEDGPLGFLVPLPDGWIRGFLPGPLDSGLLGVVGLAFLLWALEASAMVGGASVAVVSGGGGSVSGEAEGIFGAFVADAGALALSMGV